MVGLVLVCHSQFLAESIVGMVTQMVPNHLRIATAAGIHDGESRLGTDAFAIKQAIESLDSCDGILLLVDMGSAILSSETALEFLNPELRKLVRICSGPLIEGTLSAAVCAAAGGTIEEVAAEAEDALAGKKQQIGSQVGSQTLGKGDLHSVGDNTTPEAIRRVKVPNRLGLHARPAARFIQTASKYSVECLITNLSRNTGPVNGLSLNKLTTLDVRQNDELSIELRGERAQAAADELEKLIAQGFGELEDDGYDKSTTQSPSNVDHLPEWRSEYYISGVPISPGIAIGPAYIHVIRIEEIVKKTGQDPQAEWTRLNEALNQVESKLQTYATATKTDPGNQRGEIFEAYLLSLRDPVLLQSTRQRLDQRRVNAEVAWKEAVDVLLNEYRGLDSPYLRDRASDLESISMKVLQALAGTQDLPTVSEPSILLCEELNPTDIVHLGAKNLLGIACVCGGMNSHGAILARSLGIPTVSGMEYSIIDVEQGRSVALNGSTGEFWINPANKEVIERERTLWLDRRRGTIEKAIRAAKTIDGKEIKVMANVGTIDEVKAAVEFGADGIGLLRTEFLYIDRKKPPTEEEQLHFFESVVRLMMGKPVTVRTIDIGGDKPSSVLPQREEKNPFLGIRGSRIYPQIREIVEAQLKVLLRSGSKHKLRVMYPLVSILNELQELNQIRDSAMKSLNREKVSYNPALATGIMVEVPAAVFQVEQIAHVVDFFSIGTNDLAQYFFAVDRTREELRELANPFHPAFLTMIQITARAARKKDTPLSVCGELASNPLAAPLLVGFGIDELSMAPQSIPAIKEAIGTFKLGDAQRAAKKACHLSSAAEVQDLLASDFPMVNRL